MVQAFILTLVGVTSGLGLLLAWRLRLPLAGLGPAAARTLECVGVMLGFFGANLAVGMAGILLARRLTGAFWSLYYVNDTTLLLISLLQGLVFQWWRAESRATRGER